MTKRVILCGGDRYNFGWIENWLRPNQCFWISDSQTIWPDDISNFINDPRKKIVVVNVFQIHDVDFVEHVDYSWADLVIGYSPEILDDIPNILEKLKTKYNNQNLIVLCGGKGFDQPDSDRIYDQLVIPFDAVTFCNQDYVLKQLPQSKSFLFDALMGQAVHVRPWIVDKLVSSGLDTRSLISMIGSNESLPYRSPALDALDFDVVSTDWYKNAADHYNNANICSLINDLYNNFPINCCIPKQVYENSWFSIISETNPKMNFLTEKTGKCLLAGRIFVSFSTPGILAKLRCMGFKTFHDYIDESYDNIDDRTQRLQTAWKTVEYLSTVDPVKLYQEVWPIIEHNHNLIKNFQLRHANVQQFVAKFLD